VLGFGAGGIKGGGATDGVVRVNPNCTPHSSSTSAICHRSTCSVNLASDDGPPSLYLVLLLLLLLSVTSSGVEPYSLTLVPRRGSPSSSGAHRLGSTVKSDDSGAHPLLDGAAKWANQWSN
jgi:hypothetical protein